MKIQKKGRYKVIAKKITMSFLVLMCLSLIQNITFGVSLEASEIENKEYKQERTRIKALRKSLTPGPTKKIKEYDMIWWILTFVWALGETWYFGWNVWPESPAEVGCDMVAMSLIMIAFVKAEIVRHEKIYHEQK